MRVCGMGSEEEAFGTFWCQIRGNIKNNILFWGEFFLELIVFIHLKILF